MESGDRVKNKSLSRIEHTPWRPLFRWVAQVMGSTPPAAASR
jgi:hypothetical protein